MAITLWGRASSANVQKARWALAEIGLAYEHTPLGGKYGGNKEPAYLAMNPNGLIPTLRDGDLVLWESHAIVRYLAATYSAGGLWPEGPSARAIVDQWTDWTVATFQPAWVAASGPS
jgi:glutathione S-transferase